MKPIGPKSAMTKNLSSKNWSLKLGQWSVFFFPRPVRRVGPRGLIKKIKWSPARRMVQAMMALPLCHAVFRLLPGTRCDCGAVDHGVGPLSEPRSAGADSAM